MKVGDLVKHQYGTLKGSGIIFNYFPTIMTARILWTAHGQTKIHEVATRYLEVINESQ